MPAIASPTAEGDRVLSSSGESPASVVEKMVADSKKKEGAVEERSKLPSHGAMAGLSQGGASGELGSITKTTKNVAVIQPTQVCVHNVHAMCTLFRAPLDSIIRVLVTVACLL